MFNTIRSVSVHTKQAVGKVSTIIGSVRRSGSGPSINNQTTPINAEKIQHSQEPTQKGRDHVMSNSFGDGYSTRSDEESFGGTFSGNQSLSGREQEKIVNANAPEYDRSQGSETGEKEGGRNQP
ncbi:unnamed protein product [Lactuca virosa]|uniref:Uncharacterized protein n=1 Tax=Lactuca virosa TaxID=75947 RepID=A0AAU9LJ07_9ASTR|nr:unnamed protein product [Lactuca virosa]